MIDEIIAHKNRLGIQSSITEAESIEVKQMIKKLALLFPCEWDETLEELEEIDWKAYLVSIGME
jgi:hypothetical protein